MNLEGKISRLAEQAQFDLSCACGMNPPRTKSPDGHWLFRAALPDGGSVRMLKTLMDNSCSNDCSYCAQRAGRDTPRDRFSPDELARLFDQLVRAGKVEALFLSSGLGGSPVRTMDRMLAAVELIRRRYGFRGFVHLKVLPGAERAQVERAAALAQRISINLEVPDHCHMQALSAGKNFQGDILERLAWISRLIQEHKGLAKGHTTQFVVGAAGESDAEIVHASARLYQDYHLSRVYYSAFQPVPQTPLEQRAATPLMREHRLYQVDFLLRKYGFSAQEIGFDPDGSLSLNQDPKTVWAQAHPERFPVEVNQAAREELLRVPGLGPLSVDRILQVRSSGRISDMDQLRRLSKGAIKAAPYLLFGGQRHQRQLALF